MCSSKIVSVIIKFTIWPDWQKIQSLNHVLKTTVANFQSMTVYCSGPQLHKSFSYLTWFQLICCDLKKRLREVFSIPTAPLTLIGMDGRGNWHRPQALSLEIPELEP